MEKLSQRKQNVLDALDSEIEELEKRLKKVQPLIDELASLRRTRSTLLDERRSTGGGTRSGLTMETVIEDLRTHGNSTPMEISERVGVSDTTVRSHLNRFRDERYRQVNGKWALIGEDADDDDEEDDE